MTKTKTKPAAKSAKPAQPKTTKRATVKPAKPAAQPASPAASLAKSWEADLAPLRSRFAGRVKAAREAAGLTQLALAVAAKMDPNYVARIERGIHEPKGSRCWQLAQALGVTLDSLYSE